MENLIFELLEIEEQNQLEHLQNIQQEDIENNNVRFEVFMLPENTFKSFTVF